MDKAWVWLPRASLEYLQGAKQFVTDSMRLLGNPVEMLCPCIDCRNVCHQVIETVIDHLVIKGMDRKYKRNACSVLKPDAYLWRPSEDKSTIGEAVNTNIAWPLHKIELLNPPTPTESVTKTAATASISTNNRNGNPKKKCIMFDSNNSGRIVAKGQVFSSNPADHIHCAPLGPNASKVMVQVPIIGDAGVWRPTSEVQFVSDAVGTIVAWPNDKLKFV